MAVSGHCRDATKKFSHLIRLQYRKLILHFGGGRTKDLNVERHVFDIEAGAQQLHVEETRGLLVDTPKEATLVWPHIHGGVHDPYHWQVGARSTQWLRND